LAQEFLAAMLPALSFPSLPTHTREEISLWTLILKVNITLWFGQEMKHYIVVYANWFSTLW
jgi:hypothetical protein